VIVLGELDEAELPGHLLRFREAVEQSGREMGFSGLSLSIGAMVPDLPIARADAILAEADRRMYTDKRRRKSTRSTQAGDVMSLARSLERRNQNQSAARPLELQMCAQGGSR